MHVWAPRDRERISHVIALVYSVKWHTASANGNNL